jgi:hypothetical protein
MQWLSTWWVASIVANVTIGGIEFLNRTSAATTYWRQLALTAPLILVAQWGLWRAYKDAPSFMFAWIFFSVGNSLVRVLSAQYAVKEAPSTLTLLGVALMLAASYFIKIGAR